MNINLTPEQEQIVNHELKSGHFRSPEEVIASALAALRDRERAPQGGRTAQYDCEVTEMLKFVEENHTPLQGVSVKQLIRDGHRL